MNALEREINLLVSALVDDNIDAEGFQRLNELIESHEQAREIYVRLAHFHAELADVALESLCALPTRSTSVARQSSPPVGRLAAAWQVVGDWGRRARQVASQPTSISLTTATLVVGLMIAAMAAVAIPVYQYTTQSRPAAVTRPLTIARITRTHGAQWGESAERHDGETLVAGSRLELRSGLAELTFTSGARLLLDGPAVLQVLTSKSAHLESGRLTAEVPKKAAGFSVRSPCATVIDLGTEFGTAVDRNGTTDVRVFVGSVEVAMTDAARDPSLRLVLEAGQSTRVVPHDPTFRDLPAEAEPFVRTDSLSDLLAEERYKRWQTFAERVQNDPSVVAFYRFDSPETTTGQLPNAAALYTDRFAGNVDGPKWVEGRWKNKGALQFNKQDESVDLEFGQEKFDTLTLSVWINLKQLPNSHNALFYSRSWNRDGAVHWTLLDDGRIEFAVGSNQPPVTQSVPASLQYRLGRWVHLAVVYDRAAKRVQFYINGKPQGAQTYTKALSIRPQSAQLGTWEFESRNVRGRMDELIVHRRALTAEEIQEIYAAGAP